jgi:hypothetical protein
MSDIEHSSDDGLSVHRRVIYWREITEHWLRKAATLEEERDALAQRLQGSVEALQEIVAADPVDLALDPNWPQRIAAEALQTLDPPSVGGQ